MPSMASIDNPLAKFRNGAAASVDGREWPIPLTGTRIDVTIRGGLAIVVTERSFRNGEPRAIEATLTFPVPVDATLCALSARIDARVLNAVAQPRSGARKTYEDAIDQGRAAVLHEELIKGVHMLSVGQIQPAAEIAVTATWTAPLSFVGDTPRLRIPTTIGDIFGQSPLAPSDDLVVGDVKHVASVGLACEDGVASLLGARAATDGRYSVTLDHPIDVAVSSFVARTLKGVAADGRAVELTIEPLPQSSEPLAIDVLFDHSGSMTERASGNFEMLGSKFEVAKAGLIAVARNQIKSGDRLRLWEFNDNVGDLGDATGGRVPALVEKLSDRRHRDRARVRCGDRKIEDAQRRDHHRWQELGLRSAAGGAQRTAGDGGVDRRGCARRRRRRSRRYDRRPGVRRRWFRCRRRHCRSVRRGARAASGGGADRRLAVQGRDAAPRRPFDRDMEHAGHPSRGVGGSPPDRSNRGNACDPADVAGGGGRARRRRRHRLPSHQPGAGRRGRHPARGCSGDAQGGAQHAAHVPCRCRNTLVQIGRAHV